MRKVLVTGATGNVGSQVVRELRTRGVPVRAFVRDPVKGAAMLGPGVDLAVGDLADIDTIHRALGGVDRVFLASATEPRQVELECNVIDAATRAGVSRVVMAGALGAQVGSPVVFADSQGKIERHLRECGIPAVILQSTFYMTNVLMSADAIKHTGKLFAPAGGARIAMIDPADVAAAAAVALTHDGHDGKTYILTGPDAITYEQVADELSAATGRKVQFVDVPDEAARQGMIETGAPDWLAHGLLTLFRALKQGLNLQVTDTVRALTGRRPRRFAEFARDHANRFIADDLVTVGKSTAVH